MFKTKQSSMVYLIYGDFQDEFLDEAGSSLVNPIQIDAWIPFVHPIFIVSSISFDF